MKVKGGRLLFLAQCLLSLQICFRFFWELAGSFYRFGYLCKMLKLKHESFVVDRQVCNMSCTQSSECRFKSCLIQLKFHLEISIVNSKHSMNCFDRHDDKQDRSNTCFKTAVKNWFFIPILQDRIKRQVYNLFQNMDMEHL